MSTSSSRDNCPLPTLRYTTIVPNDIPTLTPSYPHTIIPSHHHTLTQIDILKRQDTSDQLRETKEQLSSLRQEHTRMAAQLHQAQGREEALRAQMVEGEGKWREKMQDVEQVREEGWER